MDAYISDCPHQAELNALEAEITELAAHLNAGNYRFLKLIAEFDTRKGWAKFASQTCAHWLNWRCGMGMNAAREKVRTAHALETLPKIASAMERGQLSYCKVRAITRVACPNTEEYFLYIARCGTGHHIETLVRQWRRAKESQELSREARQQAKRYVKYRWDDDGSLILTASLPAEIGALVLQALDAAIEANPTPQRPATVSAADFVPRDHPIDRPGRSIQRADALGVLAESFMAHGAEAMTGGDRHQVVVHVSAEMLMGNGNADAVGCCEIEHGPAIPAETARRLSCDASLVFLAETEKGEPLNIGRKTRTIPSALRRALNARDRGCRFPGCTHTRYVDHHHIRHWAHGGETKPSNLVSLCRFHHRKVHEGTVRVQILDDGALRFLRPDGVSLDSVAAGHTEPLGNWQQLPAVHHVRGIHINERTTVPLTPGDRMDYGGAVISLLRIAKTGRASLPRLPDH